MAVLAGYLLNTLLSLSIGACIRLYPLRDKLRVRLRNVVLIYILFYLAECAVFMRFHEYFTTSYSGNLTFIVLCSLIHMMIPVFLTKDSIFQNVFLYLVVANYDIVVFGAGNFIELSFGGVFATQYPYLICDSAIILLSIPLLPLTLKGMDKLLGLLAGKRSEVWKYIWIIPLMFAALCLMLANVFMHEIVVSAVFVVARVFIGAGMVVFCILLARALRQEADNARHAENARMMEKQLDLQREQYARFMENANHVKAMRHDMRHHLAVLAGYSQAGDNEKLAAYLAEITGAISADDKLYCDNFAANAVAAHYLGLAQREGIKTEARLSIPEDTGHVPAMDLCVIVGNLLENAIEACRHVQNEEKYIRANSRTDVHGTDLSIVVENSFDGEWREEKGVYLSRKETAESREGLGLSSIKAICKKHGGFAEVTISGSVWIVSAYLEMKKG